MEKNIFELMSGRRTTRSYTNENISKETLSNILKCALLAPSSFGRQPVEFWVVREKDMLRKIASCKRIGAPTVSAADTAIIVAADTDDCELWIEDCSVASAHILLAAEEYDVGACWNQIRNRQGARKSASDEIKELLSIPKRFEVVSVIALGMKAEHKPPKDISAFLQSNVHGFDF